MKHAGTLIAFVALTLLGTIAMAAESLPQNIIKWVSAPGIENPEPPSAFLYDSNIAIAYSWGRDLDRMGDDGASVPVGKFEMHLNSPSKAAITEAELAVIANIQKLQHQLARGTVMELSFSHDHIPYSAYYVDGLNDEFEDKLRKIIKIYSNTVLHGKPLIAITPTICVKQFSGGFYVELYFKNSGTESASIAGPETWSSDMNMIPAPHAIVDGYSPTVGIFSFPLTSNELVGDRQYIKQINLQPDTSVSLAFHVPYSAVRYVKKSPGKIINGVYGFGAGIKTKILLPQDMAGPALLSTDKITNIHFNEQ